MDFLSLLSRLHDHDVEFIIVGGYASMMLGSDMLTQDLDVCIELKTGNLNRLYDAIEDLNPRYRMHPAKPYLSRESATADTIKNLYLLTDLGALDCLGEIKGLGDYNAVTSYAMQLNLEFGTVKILGFEGLILAKRALNRDKDQLTIQKLEAIQQRLKEK